MAEYLGEVIGEKQAEAFLATRRRLSEPNYIMYLREHLTSGGPVKLTVIDARNYSGVARTINHSCEPNLIVLPVRIQNPVAHAALFALRDIRAGEELSYDYNPSSRVIENETRQTTNDRVACLCGSSSCRGFLPDTI